MDDSTAADAAAAARPPDSPTTTGHGAADSKELSWKLVSLVAPNYPTLADSAIDVMDPGVCRLLGTPEQRELAKQVRHAIEEIWDLDETDPVRLLWERMWTPPRQMMRLSSDPEDLDDQPQLPNSPSHPRLPDELMRYVFGFLVPKPGGPVSSTDLVTYLQLRMVSKAVQAAALSILVDIQTTFLCRVVRHFVHRLWFLSAPDFVEALASARALLAGAYAIALWAYGDEIEALNEVLLACPNIKILSIVVPPAAQTTLWALDLSTNKILKTLVIAGNVSPPVGFVFLSTLQHLHPARRACPGWMPPGQIAYTSRENSLSHIHLRHLHGYDRGLYVSVGSVISGATDLREVVVHGCPLITRDVQDLWLYHQPGTFDSMRMTDSHLTAEAARHVVEKELATSVDLSKNRVLDAAIISLAHLSVLAELSLDYNALTSLPTGLGANSSLRHLSLRGCFSAATPDLASILGRLSTELLANTTLNMIILEQNELEDAHLALLRLTGIRSGLRQVGLAMNRLTNEGVRPLLTQPGNLTLVSLAGMEKVTKEFVAQFQTDSFVVEAGSE